MQSDASNILGVIEEDADGQSQSKQLLDVLRSLLELTSKEGVRMHPTSSWVTIIQGVADGNLLDIPIPGSMAWSMLVDKIHYADSALDLVHAIVTEDEEIYRAAKDMLEKVVFRLLNITFSVELWLDLDVPTTPGLASPAQLKEKTSRTLAAVIHGMGNELYHEDIIHSSYEFLRRLPSRILELSRTLLDPTVAFTYPVSIDWLGQNGVEPFKGGDDPIPEHFLVLYRAAHAPVLLATALRTLTLAFYQQFPQYHLFYDIRVALLGGLRTSFDHCLSPAWPTTNASRCGILHRFLNLHQDLAPHQPCPEVSDALQYIATRLIQARMDGVLDSNFGRLDGTLIEFLRSPSTHPSRSLVIQATAILKDGEVREQGGELVSLSASYIRSCIAITDEDTLRLIISELSESSCPEANALRNEIQQSPKNQTQTQAQTQTTGTQAVHGRLRMKDHVWRRAIKELVSTIISPDPLAWMDDEFRPNEDYFVRRVLNDICDRFSRPIERVDEKSRIALAQELARLPCLLTLCSGQDCLAFRKPNAFNMAHLYLPATVSLLRGSDEEVTPAVRRAVFKAACYILRHRNEEDPGRDTVDMLFRGAGDKDRSTRLQAGVALQALLQVYAQASATDNSTAGIFDRLYNQIDIGTKPVREALIVSVGKMGMTTNHQILGNVICLLLVQLGRSDILLRSLACTQILSLAKHHQKTPYSLILPYQDQIAPLLVNRLTSQPALLQETCKLIGVSPADFLSINLPRTLPDVLVRCDMQGLDVLAKLLNRDRHALIVGENIHLHLAPIFLLKTPAATNKSINFMLQILNEASSVKIDLRQVLPGCTTALLTEIIVMMGDHDPNVHDLAKAAIKKVETALKTGASHPTQGSDPGAFLASQMLGIISRIIEMLQDVHGKKSVLVKQKILRSLGSLILLIGPAIHAVASQVMATFQTMISVPELSQVTVESWYSFLVTMGSVELGPHLGPTCAAFVSSWPNLSPHCRDVVRQGLHHAFSNFNANMSAYLDEIVDLSVVDELKPLQAHLNALVSRSSTQDALTPLLDRCKSNNLTVATLSLAELLRFASENLVYIQSLASGDVFDPTIGRIFSTLYKAACRDGEGADDLRLLAYQCIGMLGAMDPYRFEMTDPESDIVVTKNFTEESETMAFVLHLIQDLLVDAFRSTSDIKYQTNLAYPIQELLKYCGFSSDLVNSGRSAPMKIRNRWNSLSKDVLDVITPLLEGRFAFNQPSNLNIQIPVYPTQDSYREWLQVWTTHLISKVSGPDAQKIFRVFLSVVRSKDVVIAKHILPHIVLNILIAGDQDDIQNIRDEIVRVLEDQVNPESESKPDKKLLSAQAIFALLDHLNKWVRSIRRQIAQRKAENKRPRARDFMSEIDEQIIRVDSILSTIDQNLMARAAFQCKAYARSLMNFEQQILTYQQQATNSSNLQNYYEMVHEIYSHLDEPDGMEGISTLLLSPSMEHQIREHESTGKWTAAQSCWEVRLQHSPDNLDFHLGLLRCLRNLGHYGESDTLRNHVKGVLTNHPEWEPSLADFHVESSWMVGAWDDISSLLDRVDAQTPGVMLSKVLLAMKSDNQEQVSSSLASARRVLGAPITAAGIDGYRRTYNSALNLHMTYELELVYDTAKKMPKSLSSRRRVLASLSNVLAQRLNSTLPTFRCREPILSMRRVGFSLLPPSHPELKKEVGSTWLTSAKIARKAGHWQTAYSAMLQSQQHDAQLYCLESAKLVKASGEPLRALQELENYMRAFGFVDNLTATVVDLTVDEESMTKMKSKLNLLRARWMNESSRYEATSVLDAFRAANDLDKTESSHFYFGNFYDKCFKELSKDDKRNRGVKMNMYTVRHYSRSIRLGSKYIYHTVPRLLTLWLDNGEDRSIAGMDSFHKINELISGAIKEIPAFKWFTAFPQIVSRVGHNNDKVYDLLAKLIVMILQEYPRQALWGFASVLKSGKAQRGARGRVILEQLRSAPSSNKRLARHIADSISMINELLTLCTSNVDEEKKAYSMHHHFPKLEALGFSDLLIPLQESLTVTLPSSTSDEATHQPFPVDAPTFKGFADEVEVMKSMARPRKITIHGSDGLIYMFLGKPKDDLRKDARLMDFNSIINKLLKTNSDARRRQLHIRTYGVVTLNEECGFIQWVPNTVPIRHILTAHYDARRLRPWNQELAEVFTKVKGAKSDSDIVDLFQNKVLNQFPPVFHEWFVETFPEPSAWLASRLSFARTAAVMSMVGYILGLGDRHGENILLDLNTGDVIHVDFNCLFEKGKHLETPERVPFRLTQNIVDGLGISGVEGPYRIACEITMSLLRENKESLTSVLDAFIHDPLVEWEDEKRKRDRQMRNQAKVHLTEIAKNALEPISRKLDGYYQVLLSKHEPVVKLLETNNLVESLIQEATNLANLARMYPGWASWM